MARKLKNAANLAVADVFGLKLGCDDLLMQWCRDRMINTIQQAKRSSEADLSCLPAQQAYRWQGADFAAELTMLQDAIDSMNDHIILLITHWKGILEQFME